MARAPQKSTIIKLSTAAVLFNSCFVLLGCKTTAPDLDATPPNGPTVYHNSFNEMPEAWVDSAMGATATFSPEDPVRVERPPVEPTPPARPGPATLDLPYATPVPGKEGLVTSPYSSQGYVDVKGMPPGTMAKCPYTGKIFLAP